MEDLSKKSLPVVLTGELRDNCLSLKPWKDPSLIRSDTCCVTTTSSNFIRKYTFI